MDLKKIDWDTIGPDMFQRIKEELGEEAVNKCISLYGRGLSNDEIAETIEKIKSDSDENQV